MSTATATLSPLLDRKALADLLGMALVTLDRNILLGKIPPGAKIASMRRWQRSEIQRWLDAGCPSAADFAAITAAR